MLRTKGGSLSPPRVVFSWKKGLRNKNGTPFPTFRSVNFWSITFTFTVVLFVEHSSRKIPRVNLLVRFSFSNYYEGSAV